MDHRPFSITVICLYLIIASTIGLAKSFAVLNDPATQAAMSEVALPVEYQVAKMYLDLAVALLTGIFMFEKTNWARFVYIGWGAVSLVIGFVVQPLTWPLIYSLLIYLAIAPFLIIPTANRYFRPDDFD